MVGGTSRLWIKQVRLFDFFFPLFGWKLAGFYREREPAFIKVAY